MKPLPKIPLQGTWLCKHRLFGTIETVIAYRGTLKTDKGLRINPDRFAEFWEVIEKIPGAQNNYNIQWKVGDKVMQIILTRAPYAVVINKIKELRRTNFKTGQLIPIRCDK